MRLMPLRTSVDAVIIDAHTGRPEVDLEGNRTKREFLNSPFSYFYPGDPVFMIRWGDIGQRVIDRIKAEKAASEFTNVTRGTYYDYWLEELTRTFEVDGQKVVGWWGYGSGIKDHVTPGFVRDYLVESGLVKTDVQSGYTMRVLLPNARDGAVVIDEPLIAVVPDQMVWNGYPLCDGGFLVSQSVWDAAVVDKPSVAKLMNPTKNSYQFAQRFEWEDIKDDAERMVKEYLESFTSVIGVWGTSEVDPSDFKVRAIEVCPDLKEHPYFAEEIQSAWARKCASIASSLPLKNKTRLAVPTTSQEFVMAEAGRFTFYGYPIDGWGNIGCFDNTDIFDDPEYQEELRRISTTQYAQVSLTHPNFIGAKGVCAVVPDELMDGYDIIISCEDIKLLNLGSKKRERHIKTFREYVEGKGLYEPYLPEVVLSIIQTWEKGVSVGAPYQQWKNGAARDWDGDYAIIAPLEGYDQIYEAIERFRPQSGSKPPKIQKSLDNRPHHMANTMRYGIIGIPINCITDQFAGGPDYMDTVLAPRYGMDPMGLADWQSMASHLFTDAPKRSDDLAEAVTEVQEKASIAHAQLGGAAPWARWVNQMDQPFRHELPQFLSDRPDLVERAEKDPEYRITEDYRQHIPVLMEGSVMGHVYRLVKPWLTLRFNFHPIDGISIGERIKSRPLSDFINYAPFMPDEEVEVGHQFMRLIYLPLIKSVRWSDEQVSVPSFRRAMAERAREYADKYFRGNMDQFLVAVWRASHHIRGRKNKAAAPWLVMPEESLRLAKRYYALKQLTGEERQKMLLESGWAGRDFKCPVVGLNKNLHGQLKDVYGPATVAIEDVQLGGRTRLGIILITGEIPVIKIQRPEVPYRLVGIVSRLEESARKRKGYEMPPRGVYTARFFRVKQTDTYIMEALLYDKGSK